MSTFQLENRPLRTQSLILLLNHVKLQSFSEKNGVSGQTSAGIGGSHSQELMVTGQDTRVRTVLTTISFLANLIVKLQKDANIQ